MYDGDTRPASNDRMKISFKSSHSSGTRSPASQQLSQTDSLVFLNVIHLQLNEGLLHQRNTKKFLLQQMVKKLKTISSSEIHISNTVEGRKSWPQTKNFCLTLFLNLWIYSNAPLSNYLEVIFQIDPMNFDPDQYI